MRMLRIAFLTAAFLAVSVFAIPTAAAEPEKAYNNEAKSIDTGAILMALQSENAYERVKAREEIVLWRDRLVVQLLRVIDDNRDASNEGAKQPRCFTLGQGYALRLIRELRCPEAIACLMNKIDIQASVLAETRFPVVGCLISVGKPAVSEILERIDTETDETRLRLYNAVIRDVENIKCEGEELGKCEYKYIDRSTYPKFEYPGLSERFKDDPWFPAVKRLGSKEPHHVSDPLGAHTEIKGRIDAIVKGLVSILKKERETFQPDDELTLALELLGKFRASPQVKDTEGLRVELEQLILERLTFSDPKDEEAREDNAYPAVECLVQIGKRAMKPVLWRMRKPLDELSIKLLAGVIERIEGKPLAIRRVSEWQAGKEGSYAALGPNSSAILKILRKED